MINVTKNGKQSSSLPQIMNFFHTIQSDFADTTFESKESERKVNTNTAQMSIFTIKSRLYCV